MTGLIVFLVPSRKTKPILNYNIHTVADNFRGATKSYPL